jgi:nucleoside-diphosphate-sugar epimerase
VGKSAVVLGGTGLVGSAAVRRLADHGWEVTAAARGEREVPSGLEERARLVSVDRADSAELRTLLGGGADVLVDTVGFGRDDAQQLIELRDLYGSLVVISSAAVYADESGRGWEGATGPDDFPQYRVPILERSPTVEPGQGGYASGKVELERMLLAVEGLRTTVIRPGAIYGPGDQTPREWFFVKRALDGRRVVLLAYRGSSIFHPTSTHNLAEVIRLAAERPGPRVLNCGDPDPPTVLEIGRAIASSLDHEFVEALIPGPPEDLLGDHPWATPRPFILDMNEAEIALGYRPITRYERAVAETCRWLVDRTRGRDWVEVFSKADQFYGKLFDYEAEDRFLEAVKAG